MTTAIPGFICVKRKERENHYLNVEIINEFVETSGGEIRLFFGQKENEKYYDAIDNLENFVKAVTAAKLNQTYTGKPNKPKIKRPDIENETL